MQTSRSDILLSLKSGLANVKTKVKLDIAIVPKSEFN